jgi:hypothetical protein
LHCTPHFFISSEVYSNASSAMRDDTDSSSTESRIRDDDELIGLTETRQIMGGISISKSYTDPDLMALRIKMSEHRGDNALVRFIKREVYELRARRVAQAAADAPAIRRKIERQLELRRERYRQRRQALAAGVEK